MNQIIEQLPKAKFWAIATGVISVLGLIGQVASVVSGRDVLAGLIGAVFSGFLVYFLFSYSSSCKQAYASESEDDIGRACVAQSRVLMMYGIVALLYLIVIAIVVIAAIFAYFAYSSR